MQLQKQRHHTKETSKGKDDYGRRSLLPDIDLALGKVVAERQGSSNTYPGREKESWVFGAAREVEDPRRNVRVDRVDGEEADDGGLRGVVEEPPRHKAIGKEEGQIRRGTTPNDRQSHLRNPKPPLHTPRLRILTAGP